MKILLFTPTLARTGSEVAIFNIICNVNRDEIKMTVALGAEGELARQLPSDVPHSNYWHVETPNLRARLRRRLARNAS